MCPSAVPDNILYNPLARSATSVYGQTSLCLTITIQFRRTQTWDNVSGFNPQRFQSSGTWPDPPLHQISSGRRARRRRRRRTRAVTRSIVPPALLPSLPISHAPARARATRRRRRQIMRRRPRSRRQRGGDTGVRGNERLEIGTVQKDRLDELDAGSDGRRSKEFPSMPPSKPAQRETQSLAARSSSSAPSASSVPLLTTARSRCAA